jgi:pimeloyl-ACP methyl ester carboxylesterase
MSQIDLDREERFVSIQTERGSIGGNLVIPAGAVGVVLFAHGSGSSRFSPRNRSVARHLNQGRLGTLLIDLFTADEAAVDEATGTLRFDVPFLAARLLRATDWLRSEPSAAGLPLAYFGASTGAAAALVAAAQRPATIAAIVSRGGRPDLARGALRDVAAPTLLVVGEEDREVLELNQLALAELEGVRRLVIVPHASHLFDEPGALETVAELARDWFLECLPAFARRARAHA